jgi:formylglycine-generating enzyme required for sulfatase activity
LEDCQEFIAKLNELTGPKFSLPTEAEWEYAARGGNKSKGYKYSGSNTLGDVAWYWDNIPSQTEGDTGYGAQPIATKQANELGIYDMTGNVWEWCSDWYGSYTSEAQTNPTGLTSGSRRIFRGGSWNRIAKLCLVSYRSYWYDKYRNMTIGFRLAL